LLNSFKGSEQELRAMIEELKRANAELKTKYSPDEVQSLKEQYYITKQELDQAKREIYSMKDEIHKAGFERDSHIREVAHLNEKLTDLTSSKNKAERKTESLTEQVDKLQTNLKR
jgi:chromosome segregation ATPase